MSEKSVESAAELSAKDLKEKKEKVEEKASRKERKKEVVEEEENGAEEGHWQRWGRKASLQQGWWQ